MMITHAVALLLASTCVLSVAEQDANEGPSKLATMLEKSAKQSGLIKDLTTAQFENFISRGPRPYSTLVVLTANDKSSKCKICREVQPEVKRLAQQLESTRAAESDNQIFVVEMDYINNRELFSRMQLTSAPIILMVPSAKSRKEIPIRNFIKKVGKKNQYSLMSGRTAENFAEFIRKTTGSTVDFSRKFSQLDVILVLLALTAVLGVLFALRSYIDKIRRVMLIYAIVVMAGYAFCIGGGMFNFIRNTPFAGQNNGRVEYVSGQSRYQYQAEGYMMGVANLVAGIGAFLFVNAQRDGFEKDSRGRPISRVWAKFCPVWMPLLLVVTGWYAILHVYTSKNGHYNYGFVGMKG